MWLAFQRFQKLIAKAGPSMPVGFKEDVEQFVENDKGFRNIWLYYLTNLSVFLIWAVVNFRLSTFMQGSDLNGNRDFTTFTMDLLYWSLCNQALGAMWAFHTKSDCACWLLNQMFLKRKTHGSKLHSLYSIIFYY